MAFSPPITSVGANAAVESAFALARNFGSQSFALAFEMVNRLANFEPQGYAFDTTFTVPQALLQGFPRPEAPEEPGDYDFSVSVPAAPTFDPVEIPEFGEAPVFDGEKPLLDFSGRPAPFSKLPPAAPQLLDVTIPDEPTISLPDIPTFEELNIPDAPSIITPTFDAERPVFDVEVPDGDFAHTYTEYTQEILADVVAEVSRMLQGGTGLPPAIEQALFHRALDREDQLELRALDEVDTEFAARGFTLPSGVQLRRRDQVRQESRAAKSGTNRELTIRAIEIEIENLRFAVQQGIACESLLSQIHFQAENIKLEIARYTRDLLIALFNARIAAYNAEVAAFQADAQVFELLIRAELAKVEIYRAQIEGERARGEINQQRVDLYRARLDAVNTLISIYNSQIEGARTVAQVNESKVRAYVGTIEGFSAEVSAKESEFRAWGEQVRGELGKMDGYRAETQAFVARTQAYVAGNEAKAIAPRLILEQQQVEADQYRAEIAGVQAEIQAQATRAQAIASIFGSKASIFASRGQIAAAEAETNTRQFQAVLEQARVESEAALREAELNVNQIIALGNQLVEALRGAGQAASQLAASSFSAVNASASISESGSASNSWSESFSINIDGGSA